MSLRANNPAVGVLAPQSCKANEVLDNGNGSEQRRADAEDGIGGQLVSGEAVPHAKVHANGHEDAVDEDEEPEPENGLLAHAQRVLERRRPAEVGVVVRDLGVGVYGVRVGRCGARGICAGSGSLCCAARVALVVVARPVDVDARDLQRVGLAGAVCRRGARGLRHGQRFWPQRLCRRLLGGHGAGGLVFTCWCEGWVWVWV